MDLVNVIIFSKDRPAQLDALLRSIRERVEAWEKRALWSVVFTASTREFARGYEIVRAEHRADAIELIDERSRSAGSSRSWSRPCSANIKPTARHGACSWSTT